ncbi:MAG: hypothetical protein ALAOOOJD_04484 [bacterium]|nr:hypothetical protein [bacterium]
MQTESSPVRLTIVDFMGVFLPGLIWVILLLTMAEVLSPSGWVDDPNPKNITYALGGLHRAAFTAAPLGTFAYVGLALFALLAGYLMKAIPSRIAEVSSFAIGVIFFFPKSIMGFNKISALPGSYKLKDYLFPYPAIHQKREYFKVLEAFVESEVHQPWTDLRGYQPFSICKRLLKIYVPKLWEEIQHREAQVRMLDSLLLAALFSFVLSLIKLVLDWHVSRLFFSFRTNMAWLMISIMATVVMAAIYRLRRHREVEDVYHYTLIASRLAKARSLSA